MRQSRILVRSPQRIVLDIANVNFLARKRGGAAGTMRRTDLRAIDCRDELRRQAGTSAMTNPPSFVIQQQDRSDRAVSREPLDRPGKLVQYVDQRVIGGNQRQNAVLLGDQIPVPPGCVFAVPEFAHQRIVSPAHPDDETGNHRVEREPAGADPRCRWQKPRGQSAAKNRTQYPGLHPPQTVAITIAT